MNKLILRVRFYFLLRKIKRLTEDCDRLIIKQNQYILEALMILKEERTEVSLEKGE